MSPSVRLESLVSQEGIDEYWRKKVFASIVRGDLNQAWNEILQAGSGVKGRNSTDRNLSAKYQASVDSLLRMLETLAAALGQDLYAKKVFSGPRVTKKVDVLGSRIYYGLRYKPGAGDESAASRSWILILRMYWHFSEKNSLKGKEAKTSR